MLFSVIISTQIACYVKYIADTFITLLPYDIKKTNLFVSHLHKSIPHLAA